MGKLLRVSSQSVLNNLLTSNSLLFIKFTAAWCGPCKAVAPAIEKLESEFTSVKFVEVDVDESQAIARKYSVTSMPTFVFFHDNKEVDRQVGADAKKVADKLVDLQAKNPSAQRTGSEIAGSSSSGESIALPKEIQDRLPKGYEALNDNVHFGEAELLNVSAVGTDTIRGLLDLEKADGAVQSDADSQLMLFLPFQNKVKLHTIFIKSSKFGIKDNEDEDELQEASKIKVWANTIGTISFEDASDGVKALHDENIGEKDIGNGWRQIKLRYVHFQSITSVLIFLDGEDEDNYTVLEKIYLVGSKGDSREVAKLERPEDD